MKLGLQATADYFKSKGDFAITKHYLYQGSRNGSLPFVNAGNRIIFDTELLEEHFKLAAINNIKKGTDNIVYGQLRKVNL